MDQERSWGVFFLSQAGPGKDLNGMDPGAVVASIDCREQKTHPSP